jgi:threonine dehydrogenase-like Zn-dependent dehydrogenase
MGIVGSNGAFAERVRLPAANLHRVPDTLSDSEAVFTEPLAAAYEILEQIQVQPDWRIAILGDGKLGLLCAQVLRLTGAEVVIIGRHDTNLRVAATLGIPAVTVERAPRGVDLVVEASGRPGGLAIAQTLVRPRGTLILKSTVATHHTVNLAPLVINEVRLIGSRCGNFAAALRGLAARHVSVTPLIADVMPLAEGAAAIRRSAQPGVLKILIRM